MKQLLVAICILFGANLLYANVAFVQSAHNAVQSSATLTVTLGATPANGDLLVCSIANGNPSISSVTGGGGGTWTQISHTANHVNNDIWASQLVSSGTTTITITFGSATQSLGAAVCSEWSGVTTTVDVKGTGFGGNTNPATGTIATTTNGDLVVASFQDSTSNVTITSGPTGYNPMEGNAGIPSGITTMGASYLIQGTAGNTSTNWNVSASVGWDAAIVAFKPAASSGIARVQSCENASAAVSSVACTPSNNVGAGNQLLVLCRTTFSNTISSVSDTLGNTFPAAATSWSQGTNPGNTGTISYVVNSKGGADTVTCNGSGSGGMMIVVAEYNGAGGGVDKTANAVGASTAGSTGSTAATTTANELLFSGCGTSVASGFVSITAGTSYSMVQQDTQLLTLGGAEDRFVNATGAYAGTMTFSPTNNWGCGIVTVAASTVSTRTRARIYAY